MKKSFKRVISIAVTCAYTFFCTFGSGLDVVADTYGDFSIIY